MKNSNDEMLKEILEEDKRQTRSRKKNWFVRLLFFVVVLFILGLGFIYFQQYLLNLEAEAIVRAAKTSTALASGEDLALEEEPSVEEKSIINEATITVTPSPDPAFVRTATIAAQLTDVADFQQSITHEP